MKYDLPHFPIHTVLPTLKTSLEKHQSVILTAEPGSGKTTIAPLALINEPWLQGKKILLLAPRRIAARMAAKRMSDLANDKVGGLVGYRIRFDKKVSSRTRIEVITEGIFTRIIQNDPELKDIGLVIFDEYHLRSLESDLALALCLDILELRDDLKIIIMSATIDTQQLSKLLGGAPVITGQGRCFPVAIHYLPRASTDFLVNRTVSAIHRSLAKQEGDILVFLPGAGEINAVQKQIDEDILCLPLYGNLPQKKQDLIFAPITERRVILATPIAETSLTIEGVSVVIDSGLMKVPSFSPATGLTTLQTVAISKASAEQRTGRAGRLGPGVCYRLWPESEHFSRAEFLSPEIIDADLAPLLLKVLQWGVTEPGELTWLDPPRTGSENQARNLLVQLGAVNQKGSLTDIGRQIASLPLHPRLAMMLLYGRDHGNGLLACRLAALLQNRDLFRGNNRGRSVDIEDRLDILRLFEQKGPGMVRARGAEPSLCRRILQEARQYQQSLSLTGNTLDFQESGNLLAIAYPDRIAMKKPGSNQHILSSGRGVILQDGDHLHHAEFLVAANVDGGKKQGRIFLGAALAREDIIKEHNHLLTREDRVVWDKNHVDAASILSLGSLELTRELLPSADPYSVKQCLIKGIQQTGIDCLGWQKKSREVQARMQSAHVWDPETWPDVSNAHLIKDLSWLEPYLDSITTLKQLKKLNLYPILVSLLSWQEQQKLDKFLPTHIQVPSGSKKRLLYQPGEPPVLAVRLQEMFGETNTPTVFGGKIPVLIHLLSPASRPIQVTQDITGFWERTYNEVKKELKGRYPKHYWPDNPLTAKATSRVRSKKR